MDIHREKLSTVYPYGEYPVLQKPLFHSPDGLTEGIPIHNTEARLILRSLEKTTRYTVVI